MCQALCFAPTPADATLQRPLDALRGELDVDAQHDTPRPASGIASEVD
jgi:hypothetical protein